MMYHEVEGTRASKPSSVLFDDMELSGSVIWSKLDGQESTLTGFFFVG
jgi:hypothetical protein